MIRLQETSQSGCEYSVREWNQLPLHEDNDGGMDQAGVLLLRPGIRLESVSLTFARRPQDGVGSIETVVGLCTLCRRDTSLSQLFGVLWMSKLSEAAIRKPLRLDRSLPASLTLDGPTDTPSFSWHTLLPALIEKHRLCRSLTRATRQPRILISPVDS